MRILIVHNKYLQYGGEDAVVMAESNLLRRHGIDVRKYERDNRDIADLSSLRVAADTIWSRRSSREVGALLDRSRVDVVHCHNTFPLVSPSVYRAAADRGIPVVQSLHNFRLMCPQAFLLRNDKPCEDCLGKLPWRGVMHRCRKKFIQSGLPAERIVVKPNFVDLPQVRLDSPRSGALFVGRLSREKGVYTIADAFRTLRSSHATLHAIGDGPDAAALSGIQGVHLHGPKPSVEIYDAMARAAYLLMPSIWYENFPRVLVEAFACGLPVITSRLGAMAELVQDGHTGLLVEPGNAVDLADKIGWAQTHPAEMREMGLAARRHYENNYTGEANFSRLSAIYREAIMEVS
jgi:glycosyltransferase involved in cell wall biosynthesis